MKNEKNKWVCPSCNQEIRPGDQVCRDCGSAIHNTNVTIEDLREHSNSVLDQKKPRSFFLLIGICIIAFLFLVFFFFWYGILK